MTARPRDERGAALVLALAVLVVAAVGSLAMLNATASGLKVRTALASVRNREYAADGAIQFAIAQLRGVPASASYAGPGLATCGPYSHTLNGVSIRVECAPASTATTGGILQRNVVFSACVASGSTTCGQASTPIVVRAQVNYEATGTGASLVITRTWIQSWSVST